LRNGQSVGKYAIDETLSHGGFANAYRATGPSGDVFLKQYKTPTVETSWYKAYVQHQAQLKQQVEATAFNNYTYRFVEFFEANIGIVCYFQVFEYACNGKNLAEVLTELKGAASAKAWAQRVILAKVFLAGLRAMHAAGIVHTDLKPENVQLFKADHIELGYIPKIVDLDFAILESARPPWHNDPNFSCVGTDGYRSPEHLGGVTPTCASDMFTAGLMLYEILAGENPYDCDSPEEYAARVNAVRATPPRLLGAISPPADSVQIANIVHRCLSLDMKGRPTANDVHEALTGRRAAGPGVSARPPAPKSTISLVGDKGTMTSGVTLALGQGTVRTVSSEGDYWDSEQAALKKTASGWQLEPCKNTKNETLLNGRAVLTATPLKAGDVISVGRAAKNVCKGPLNVVLE
jgi:serine/threonine protein kinase